MMNDEDDNMASQARRSVGIVWKRYHTKGCEACGGDICHGHDPHTHRGDNGADPSCFICDPSPRVYWFPADLTPL